MTTKESNGRDPEARIQLRDKLAHVANDMLEASVGAAAGGAIGVLAGPVGVVAGAAIGAVAGGVLAFEADRERDEREALAREVDDIDAEEEFFGAAHPLGAETLPPKSARELAPMATLAKLREEHAVIESGLEALSNWARELLAPDAPDTRMEAVRFATFMRWFVEERHLQKEDSILFPALERAGLLRESDPLYDLRGDIPMYRAASASLDTDAWCAEAWTPERRQAVAERLSRYADSLRAHIVRAETVLFPLAEAHLPAGARAEVDERIAAFDGPHADLDKTLRELVTTLAAAHVDATL
ncbi:MAG: hemerythrin domain-containing protein [Polyangiaceae bacterium]